MAQQTTTEQQLLAAYLQTHGKLPARAPAEFHPAAIRDALTRWLAELQGYLALVPLPPADGAMILQAQTQYADVEGLNFDNPECTRISYSAPRRACVSAWVWVELP